VIAGAPTCALAADATSHTSATTAIERHFTKRPPKTTDAQDEYGPAYPEALSVARLGVPNDKTFQQVQREHDIRHIGTLRGLPAARERWQSWPDTMAAWYIKTRAEFFEVLARTLALARVRGDGSAWPWVGMPPR
jgi:hypothetical protein